MARTIHRAPWQTSGLQPLTSDVWDLYDVKNDFSLTKNLAAEQPAKLKEMQALFMTEAEKYHVLPIDDRTIERTNPATRGPARRARRPHVAHALRRHAGHARKHLHEHQEPVEQDHRGARDSGRPRQRRDPVAGRALRRLVALHEGWQAGLHLQLPRAGALHRHRAAGAAAGPVTVTLDFAYDGGGAGKGGKATLLVNGKAVAEGRVEKTQPNIFSADETADVGIDNQTPVAEGIGIGAETRFTGTINKITLEVRVHAAYEALKGR